MTNGDRIRQMTVEELAKVIDICPPNENPGFCDTWGEGWKETICYKCRLGWLKQEVNENG